MQHRIHLAITLAAIAATTPLAASANPGLLHKHGARPVGVPATLPGQTSPIVGAATTTAPSVGAAPAPGAAVPPVAIATVVPGSDGSAVAGVVLVGGADGVVIQVPDGLPAGGMLVGGGPAVDPGQIPICVMPAPDGLETGLHGGPRVFHKLHPGAIAGNPGAIDPGIVDSGMVMVDGPPPAFVAGSIDVGAVHGGGDMPEVLYAAFPPGGPGVDGGGPRFVHQPMHASLDSAAPASTADVAGSSGRALAGGLPNRAAGVRTDSLATIRHHGHGPAPKPAGVAVSGDDTNPRVVQAGGVADDAPGTASHDGRSKLAASAAAGQAVVPPAAAASPRWRDRLRLAWPTKK